MSDSDIREKVGFIDARTHGISEDVKEIKEMLKVLPVYHDRITSNENDIRTAKKVVNWCFGIISIGVTSFIGWLFKGHA